MRFNVIFCIYIYMNISKSNFPIVPEHIEKLKNSVCRIYIYIYIYKARQRRALTFSNIDAAMNK